MIDFPLKFLSRKIHLGQFPIVPCSNLGNFKSIMLILLKGKFHNRLSEVAPYKDCWLGKTYCWDESRSQVSLKTFEILKRNVLSVLHECHCSFLRVTFQERWLASVAAPGLCSQQQRVSIRGLQPVKRWLSQVPREEVLERETRCRCVGSWGSSARRLEPESKQGVFGDYLYLIIFLKLKLPGIHPLTSCRLPPRHCFWNLGGGSCQEQTNIRPTSIPS